MCSAFVMRLAKIPAVMNVPVGMTTRGLSVGRKSSDVKVGIRLIIFLMFRFFLNCFRS